MTALPLVSSSSHHEDREYHQRDQELVQSMSNRATENGNASHDSLEKNTVNSSSGSSSKSGVSTLPSETSNSINDSLRSAEHSTDEEEYEEEFAHDGDEAETKGPAGTTPGGSPVLYPFLDELVTRKASLPSTAASATLYPSLDDLPNTAHVPKSLVLEELKIKAQQKAAERDLYPSLDGLKSTHVPKSIYEPAVKPPQKSSLAHFSPNAENKRSPTKYGQKEASANSQNSNSNQVTSPSFVIAKKPPPGSYQQNDMNAKEQERQLRKELLQAAASQSQRMQHVGVLDRKLAPMVAIATSTTTTRNDIHTNKPIITKPPPFFGMKSPPGPPPTKMVASSVGNNNNTETALSAKEQERQLRKEMLQASQGNIQEVSDRKLPAILSSPPSATTAIFKYKKDDQDMTVSAKEQERLLRKEMLQDIIRRTQNLDRKLSAKKTPVAARATVTSQSSLRSNKSSDNQKNDDAAKEQERRFRKEFLQAASDSQRDMEGSSSGFKLTKTPSSYSPKKSSKKRKTKRGKSRRKLGDFLQEESKSSRELSGAPATVTGVGCSSSSVVSCDHESLSVGQTPSVAYTVADPQSHSAKERERQFRKEFLQASQDSQRGLQAAGRAAVAAGVASAGDDTSTNKTGDDSVQMAKERERQFRKEFLQASQESERSIQLTTAAMQESDRSLSVAAVAIVAAARAPPLDDENSVTPKERERQYRKDFLHASQSSMTNANNPGSSRQLGNGTDQSAKEHEQQCRKEFIRASQRSLMFKELEEHVEARRLKKKRKRKKKKKKKRASQLSDFLDNGNRNDAAFVPDEASSLVSSMMHDSSASAPACVSQSVADGDLRNAKARERQFRKNFLEASQRSLQDDNDLKAEQQVMKKSSSRRLASVSDKRGLPSTMDDGTLDNMSASPFIVNEDGGGKLSRYSSSQSVKDDAMQSAKERERRFRKDYLQASDRSIQESHGDAIERKMPQVRLNHTKPATSTQLKGQSQNQAVEHDPPRKIVATNETNSMDMSSMTNGSDRSLVSGRSSSSAAKFGLKTASEHLKGWIAGYSTQRASQKDGVEEFQNTALSDLESKSCEVQKSTNLVQGAIIDAPALRVTSEDEKSGMPHGRSFSKITSEVIQTKNASERSPNIGSFAAQDDAAIQREAKENEKMGMARGRSYKKVSKGVMLKMNDSEHSINASASTLRETPKECVPLRLAQTTSTGTTSEDVSTDGIVCGTQFGISAPTDLLPSPETDPADPSEPDQMNGGPVEITVCRPDTSDIRTSLLVRHPSQALRQIFGPNTTNDKQDYESGSESDSEYDSDGSSSCTDSNGSYTDSDGSCTDSSGSYSDSSDYYRQREKRKTAENNAAGYSRAPLYSVPHTRDAPPSADSMTKEEALRYGDVGKTIGSQDTYGYDPQSGAPLIAQIPGAYSRTPGRLVRNATIPYSLVRAPEDGPVEPLAEDGCLSVINEDDNSDETASMDGSTNSFIPVQSSGLVEAIPIDEHMLEEGYVEAAPVDMEAKEAKLALQQKRTKHWKIFSIIAILLSVVVIAVSVIFGRKKRGDVKVEILTSPPVPTPAPTDAPTPAPVTPCCFLEVPNFTLEALEDPASPQSLAWDWIYEDIMLSDTYYSEARKLQRFAMATLYFATDGLNWEGNANWLNFSSHECSWYYKGDTPPCGEEGDILKEILLYNNGLFGTIPPEISLLTGLTGIDMQSSKLVGTIPSQLGDLQKIEFLTLGANELTGTVPLEIYKTSRLRGLGLQGNLLTGSLPTELGDLGHLEELWLNSNKNFTGYIPSEIGFLTSLSILAMNNNELMGSVPSEIGQLLGLSQIWLDKNRLTGPVPSEIGMLANLTNMTISYNQLSQTIPTEIGRLSQLEWLRMYSNQLSGPIPSEIGSLVNLFVLSLGYNELSQALPSELWQLTRLGELRVHVNYLSGDIPPGISNMTDLFALSLFSNVLSGTVPTEIGKLSRLEELLLGDNTLSGTLPTEIGSAHSLFTLDLAECLFSGSIPLELSYLVPLQKLWLFKNALTGALPSELASLTHLSDLKIGENLLNETIPSELGLLSNKLQFLSFGLNDLVGQLPSEIGKLTKLEQLAFHNTLLSGSLPTEIALLNGTLQSLLAFQAGLTGTLPIELGEFSLLRDLLLAKNQLVGSIPSSWSKLENLERLHLENNQLTGSIPRELGLGLRKLGTLVLTGNNFNQSIPTQFGRFESLTKLGLSQNALTGPLPSELGLLGVLEVFHARSNQLSGQIPSELGQATSLVDLVLGFNSLTGTLPAELSGLVNLTRLHLNDNDLTGSVSVDVCELDWQEVLIDCDKLVCECGCACSS